MLMAAVTSTLPGTDTKSSRPAASGHTESAGISFVESLAENAVVVGEKSFALEDHAKQGNAVESIVSTPAETAPAAASAMSVTQKIKDATEEANPLRSLEKGTGTGPVANKLVTTIASVVPQLEVKQSVTHAVSQINTSADKPKLVAPGSAIRQGQKAVNDAADGGTPEETDGADALDSQTAVLVATSVANGIVKQALPGKTVMLIPGEGQNKDSAGTVAKDQGSSLKTEKSAKAEVKQDKKGKADVVVSAVGIDAQTTVFSQVSANPAVAQQSVAGDAGADGLSAVSDVVSRRNIGIAASANGKNNKATANPGKPDGNTVKASGSSLVENPPSQKTATDATKPDLVIAVNADADKPKSQSAVPLSTDTGQLHAVSLAAGSALGVVSGNGPAHNAGVGLHTTESISHAVAIAQTGPNFVDTSAPVDAAHKTLAATPTSLEVGISDGTHGWLKIRAELADGGSVNTSLSPSSLAGQEMLHRELPSLATYLKSEHVAVNAVVIQPMPASGFDTRGALAGNGGGGHGLTQQSGSQGREGRQGPSNPTPAHTGANVSYSSAGAVGEDEIFSSISYGQGGGWLSVRA